MKVHGTMLQLGAATIAACALTVTLPAAAQNASSSGNATQSRAEGQVSRADRGMMKDLAEANIAEIETGKLAQQKGASSQVKEFGKRMVDDHSKSLEELRDIASKKGVELPNDTDLKHKASAKVLERLDGDKFDKQYMSMVGVSDHKRTHEMLQKVQNKATDPDLKAYAAKTIPVVHGHLESAQQLAGKK